MGLCGSTQAAASVEVPARSPGRGAGPGQQSDIGFRRISDRYETIEEVQAHLERAGLESSELIVAIDFTKSNMTKGYNTNNGQPLHYLWPDGRLNQYEAAIDAIGRTLSPFDDDNRIPVYGFGDANTKNRAVFPMKPGNVPATGFGEVLALYRAVAPGIALSGPTNFAPAIYEAMRVVKATGSFHVLLIIADGMVTDKAATERAIVEASRYPLSIVIIGVGDGPWDTMRAYDDELPQRAFDNFQFVDLNRVARECGGMRGPRFEASFALDALMEVPMQFQTLKQRGWLSLDYIATLP